MSLPISRRTKVKVAARGGRYAARHPHRATRIARRAIWAYHRRVAILRAAVLAFAGLIAGAVVLRLRRRSRRSEAGLSPEHAYTQASPFPRDDQAPESETNEGAVTGAVPNIPHAANGGGHAAEADDGSHTPPHGDELAPEDIPAPADADT